MIRNVTAPIKQKWPESSLSWWSGLFAALDIVLKARTNSYRLACIRHDQAQKGAQTCPRRYTAIFRIAITLRS